jgi:hypothetical protein
MTGLSLLETQRPRHRFAIVVPDQPRFAMQPPLSRDLGGEERWFFGATAVRLHPSRQGRASVEAIASRRGALGLP